jgi:hypothetical protein
MRARATAGDTPERPEDRRGARPPAPLGRIGWAHGLSARPQEEARVRYDEPPYRLASGRPPMQTVAISRLVRWWGPMAAARRTASS